MIWCIPTNRKKVHRELESRVTMSPTNYNIDHGQSNQPTHDYWYARSAMPYHYNNHGRRLEPRATNQPTNQLTVGDINDRRVDPHRWKNRCSVPNFFGIRLSSLSPVVPFVEIRVFSVQN